MQSADTGPTPPFRPLANALPYWISLLLIPLAVAGAAWGGLWVFALPLATWTLFAAIDAVTDKFGPMNDEQRMRFARVSLRQRPDGLWSTNYDPKIAWAFKEAETLDDVDMWPLWSLIRCPVLVMRGAESDLLSAETAARMAAEGPKAEIHEVPGVGHAPALMTAGEIDRIASFLEG